MPGPHYRSPDFDLTARQLDVLRLAACGLTIAETAAELFLSYHTVKTHRELARDKLGARTTPHAVAQAMRKGLLA